MQTVSEEWRPVIGFPLYEASSHGRVRSVDRLRTHWAGGQRKINGRILKPIPNRGYLVVKLGGPNMARGIHQVVALAFIGIPPDGHVVNHKDGIKTNNVPENLEYITDPENVKHAYRTGLLSNTGAKNGNARLSDEQVKEIRLHSREGWKNSELARRFNVSRTHIRRLISGAMRAMPDDAVAPRLATAS